ncbi:hypothetical protein QJS66_21975 [Kocuria rhizophila]|nr:hypothetical protein QJS66_21975 [Kocuria rhizophila]
MPVVTPRSGSGDPGHAARAARRAPQAAQGGLGYSGRGAIRDVVNAGALDEIGAHDCRGRLAGHRAQAVDGRDRAPRRSSARS